VAPAASAAPAPCKGASAKIAQLRDADQAARKRMPTVAEWPAIQAADLQRCSRVSELFAAGCLTTASDYFTAALIFQHGTVPEHYLQTILFASRAVALGDASARSLMALGADRYLVNTKHKQLFGSQSYRTEASPCWCMPQVEPTFPDEQRVAYVGKTLEQQRERVRSTNAGLGACAKVECDEDLQPSPQGSVPGVW
jgi:hypothetical protein